MTTANLEFVMAATRKGLSRKRKDPSKPFYADAQKLLAAVGTRHDWQAVLEELTDLIRVA
jgi:hypothetical protein